MTNTRFTKRHGQVALQQSPRSPHLCLQAFKIFQGCVCMGHGVGSSSTQGVHGSCLIQPNTTASRPVANPPVRAQISSTPRPSITSRGLQASGDAAHKRPCRETGGLGLAGWWAGVCNMLAAVHTCVQARQQGASARPAPTQVISHHPSTQASRCIHVAPHNSAMLLPVLLLLLTSRCLTWSR